MKNNDKVEDNRGYKFEVLPKIASIFTNTKFESSNQYCDPFRETWQIHPAHQE